MTLLLAAADPARAQGLFDFLFKPPQPPPEVRSYAPPTPRLGTEAPAVRAPRLSGVGRTTSYCVRLCDGRYFPIQRKSAAAGEICNSLCPASKTRIFSGSAIDDATASDGTKYSGIENAFVYREKVVDGCTCNGIDAFGLAKIAVADDLTLRKGDMIATENGLRKYTGSALASAKSGNASDADPALTSGLRGSVGGEPVRERLRKRRSFSFFGVRF